MTQTPKPSATFPGPPVVRIIGRIVEDGVVELKAPWPERSAAPEGNPDEPTAEG